MEELNFKHGGNIYSHAKEYNISPSKIIDSSASLIPFSAPSFLIEAFYEEIKNEGYKYYPEKNQEELKSTIAKFHNLDSKYILPGNGASELITWIGYEASKFGKNSLPIPGFVDYERALNCWNAEYELNELPNKWSSKFPQSFPLNPKSDVIWITNPHNPTGQLWEKKSLENIIKKYKLVICDEAFLSLTPNGESESLIPLIKKYDNLIVIRSLTKLFAIAGVRLGYVVSAPIIIKKLNMKRDPWPLNSFAIKAGIKLLENKKRYTLWTNQIHNWINYEKNWITSNLDKIKQLKVHNSATNFFLIESTTSLTKNIIYLANRGILIRECSSFRSLSDKWARISLQNTANNKKLVEEIHNSFLK